MHPYPFIFFLSIFLFSVLISVIRYMTAITLLFCDAQFFKRLFIHVHVLVHPCTLKICYYFFHRFPSPISCTGHPFFFYSFSSCYRFQSGYCNMDNFAAGDRLLCFTLNVKIVTML